MDPNFFQQNRTRLFPVDSVVMQGLVTLSSMLQMQEQRLKKEHEVTRQQQEVVTCLLKLMANSSRLKDLILGGVPLSSSPPSGQVPQSEKVKVAGSDLPAALSQTQQLQHPEPGTETETESEGEVEREQKREQEELESERRQGGNQRKSNSKKRKSQAFFDTGRQEREEQQEREAWQEQKPNSQDKGKLQRIARERKGKGREKEEVTPARFRSWPFKTQSPIFNSEIVQKIKRKQLKQQNMVLQETCENNFC